MKKNYFITLFVALFLLVGCGRTVTTDGMTIKKRNLDKITDVKKKVSDSSTVTCSIVQNDSNFIMDQKVNMNFSSDKLKSASIVIDAKLDETYLDYIDVFVETLKKQFDNFQYGSNIEIVKTSTGARVTYTMDEDNFFDQYGSASTKSAIISEMEKAGFSCN